MMKKIICLVIVVCVILLTGCADTREIVSRNLDTYATDCESVENASDLMLNIENLGDYSQIKYTYQKTCYSKFAGFYSDGLALFVKYNEENYAMQKEKVLQSYTFLDEPVLRSSDTYELPVTEFEYRGYLIKIVPDPEYIDCSSFMMIGLDDDNNAVVYLYFYDSDLDYIAEKDEDLDAEMCTLVNDAFAWETF